MRITFAPTAIGPYDAPAQHTVSLETPHDDLDISEIVRLLRGALVAWGFHPANVDDLIPPEEVL